MHLILELTSGFRQPIRFYSSCIPQAHYDQCKGVFFSDTEHFPGIQNVGFDLFVFPYTETCILIAKERNADGNICQMCTERFLRYLAFSQEIFRIIQHDSQILFINLHFILMGNLCHACQFFRAFR